MAWQFDVVDLAVVGMHLHRVAALGHSDNNDPLGGHNCPFDDRVRFRNHSRLESAVR